MAVLKRWMLVSLAGLLACHHGGSSPQQADGGFPGYPSPPLDDLVREVTAKRPPPDNKAPYERPAPITVPHVAPVDLSSLPKDDQGRPIVDEIYGIRMVINPARRDPITAMGGCLSLVGGCAQPATVANRRTLDACWAYAPSCRTDSPWLESAECCPVRCAGLYQRLRELGYPPLDASHLTADGSCFNALREYLEAPR